MARKIFTYISLIVFVLFSLPAFGIDCTLSNYPFTKNSIVAISVKDLNGKVLYQKNSNILVHPASTLKIFTSIVALNELGDNYYFKTGFYKNNEVLYLQLGADSLFSKTDMDKLVSNLSKKDLSTIKTFAIDDFIVDDITYGTGWQHDDNASIFFPQISPYVLNRNIFDLKIEVNENKIIPHGIGYNEPIINKLKKNEKNNIVISRDLFKKNSPITLTGMINSTQIVQIPVIDTKRFYMNNLYFYFKKYTINMNFQKINKKLPQNSQELVSVSHSIKDILKRVNSNSDNLAAELLFKVGGKGTTKNGIKLFKHFYNSLGIATENNIIIVDGSGASMNDYVTCDWMSTSLIKIRKNKYFNTFYDSLSDNHTGSFKNRLIGDNINLKVKTGTLANTSAVIGYMKTKKGNEIVFSIVIDNLPIKNNAKMLENDLIRKIYLLY